MRSGYQPSNEFVELLVAVTESELDATQHERLSEILRDDEAARDYYVDYISMHAMLDLRHHGTPPVDVALEATSELVSKPPSNWSVWLGFAIAASVLVAVGYPIYQQYGPSRDVVATLIDGDRLQWQNPEDQPTDGNLRPGIGRVPDGTGHLQLSGGVRIVMQGPADFELLEAPNRFKFDRGIMRAVVPPEVTGFTVIAAGHEIVDLGTEFGLSIDKYNDVEVHVFKGSVRVADKVTLKAGEGQGIDHKGSFYQPRREAKSYPSLD